MGKWVVVPKHPSNAFFEQFPNCLMYRTDEEFAANLYWALTNEPAPLTKELRHTITWEAATSRLITASMITATMHQRSTELESTNQMIGWMHEAVSKGAHGDIVRLLAGGKGAASQMEFIKKHGSAEVQPSAINDEHHHAESEGDVCSNVEAENKKEIVETKSTTTDRKGALASV